MTQSTPDNPARPAPALPSYASGTSTVPLLGDIIGAKCFGMGMGNLGCTSHGATMIIPAPGFDPALTLKAVQDERCTSLYGVPTMFIARAY